MGTDHLKTPKPLIHRLLVPFHLELTPNQHPHTSNPVDCMINTLQEAEGLTLTGRYLYEVRRVG